jgi:hypothetical protein
LVRRVPVGHDRIFCRGSRGSAFSGCAPRTVIIVKLNKARVRVKETPCVVSVAEHTGWAHVVCVAARDRVPVVVARRRVALIDPGLPTLPYEHESSAMPHAEADALVAMVRRSIASRTAEALRRITTELAPEHAAIALAIRQPPFDDLPATVAEVRASYRLLCAADGMLYQLAVCRAARRLHLDVRMYRRREETALAAQRLGVTPAVVDEFVAGRGRPAGPPWTQEHRQAFAAGIAALAAHMPGRLQIPEA